MVKKIPLTAALLALLVQGCAMTAGEREYPRHWKPTVPAAAGKCPDITGGYQNTGLTGKISSSASAAYGPYLTDFLAGGRASGISDKTVFITSPAEGELKITCGSGQPRETMETVLSMAKGDYTCGEGGITIKKSRTVRENIAGIEMSTYYITKSLDGALIVDDHESGLGLAMCLFPVGNAENTWYRFEAAK